MSECGYCGSGTDPEVMCQVCFDEMEGGVQGVTGHGEACHECAGGDDPEVICEVCFEDAVADFDPYDRDTR